MNTKESIAVLAGTPVDTQMGVEVLGGAGLTGLPFPLAEDPRHQTAFQISSDVEKQAKVRSVLQTAMDRGCRKAFVYCNSLSSAVDFEPLAAETGMRIVTPLEVYRSLAGQYRRLGFIAANAQGLAGIERTLYGANPDLELLGACLLPAVLSIEAGMDPAELVARHRLAELASWFRQCGMEALLLGCTHFPYFKEALATRTELPLLDPAVEMVRRILT
ncbi:Asp/Glu/hydantoin racemase [Oscillibacter valericigenes]|uniref:Asp/Glu/hydantoin racemase n=1 Tax=Oscillibacter valericigenes TaxID=351091 RepID=UPI001F2FB636|nr:Asp/Glu/hydantoin racemase [Oscillibacter valericigenes]MCF2664473.1 Asp/Glu/hydantoin racemase [Oscillibacter valericigenes]